MLPLFWVALAFSVGILVAHYIAPSIWIWAFLCIACLLGFLSSRVFPNKFHPFTRAEHYLKVSVSILLLCVTLGGLRTALVQPAFTRNDLAWYNDRGSYTLVALIDQPPDRREAATYLHISARELYDPESMTYQRISGTALVRVSGDSSWQLGDLLRFTASPQTPTEDADFSYQAYLERQGVYTVIYHPTSVSRIAAGQASKVVMALDWLHQRASQSIFSIFPQPESGLLAGILLGSDNDLPLATQQAYQDTGTAHIIAISGFNMAILAALFLFLFTRVLNRYWAAVLSALALISYAAFVGGSPSVIRAAIMAIMAFFGHLIGRKGGSLNALGLAAWIMLGINPLLLWDASFQLSFAATAGLVLFAEPMKSSLEGLLTRRFSEQTAARFTGPVAEYFLFSLAAQITTLPVIALQFKRLSLTSLLANPLVLPVQSAILVAGGVVTILGMLWPLAGKALAVIFVWPLLAYSNRMVEWLAQIPSGVLTISGSFATWISIGAIMITMLAVISTHFKEFFKRIRFIYYVCGLTIMALLIWSFALRQPDGQFHLTLYRTETGTTLYARSPNGQTLLIDPSGSSNTLAGQLSQTVSPWDFHIDDALLTNRDTVQTLTDLNARLPVKLAILTSSVYQVTDDQAALTLPDGMQLKKLAEAESICIDTDLVIQPLAADASDTALLLTYRQLRILIPNGVDPALLASSAASLNGLSVLILNDTDLANLPADMWQNFGAKTILWNSTSIAPDPAWPGLDRGHQISITTNGIIFWVS